MLKKRWKLGDEWIMGTYGGLKDGIGTGGVTLYNKTIERELCSSMSVEKCDLNHLHSTR